MAYKIQEHALGTAERKQRKLSEILKNHFSRAATLPVIKPGTRLVREWRGQVHVVEAADEGYRYKGERHASLSEIARLITGTRWSDPLFFGLRTNQTRKRTDAQRH